LDLEQIRVNTKHWTKFTMNTLVAFLVEDNPRIRENLIPAMAELGASSVMATAESESEAIGWLAKHKGQWDLAVVDFCLKEGTGLAVVRWCDGRNPDQHVVVLTNYPTPATRAACLAVGADQVFDKSAELEDFFAYCLDIRKKSPRSSLQ
jgi:ActR/RegA family two-component response regulator